MEIKAVLKQYLEKKSGVSKAGKNWQSQDILVTFTDGNYTKELVLSCLGEPIANRLVTCKIGNEYKFYFSVNSQSYVSKTGTNGYITKCNCFRIDNLDNQTQPQPIQANVTVIKNDIAEPPMPISSEDDLPF